MDYQNDAEFWYDLPANFDVLDASYRMYLWTGDLSYLNDPVFLNFYDRTVSDYGRRWGLSLHEVMRRPRLMNVRGTLDPHNRFQLARGIPGYDEGRHDFVVGVDLLAAQYAAYHAYSFIQACRGRSDATRLYADKAAKIKALVNTAWWDDKDRHFYAFLDENFHLQGHAGADLLYYGVAEDGPKAKAALDDLLDRIKEHPSSAVEGESRNAEILYRYGIPDVAYTQIMDLTREGRNRQEYPEVSYSVVGAIVTGLMGINLEAPPPRESSVRPYYVQVVVNTLSGLTNQTAWAELRNLSVRTNEISVRQEGTRKTVLANQSGPSLIWQAAFPGSHETLLVNGKPLKAHPGREPLGRVTSWVRVPVGAGDAVTAEVPNLTKNR